MDVDVTMISIDKLSYGPFAILCECYGCTANPEISRNEIFVGKIFVKKYFRRNDPVPY